MYVTGVSYYQVVTLFSGTGSMQSFSLR